MIHKEDETEVEVTWEDQQMINTFGRLNGRYHELAEELRGKKDELATVEDASSEIFLIDDEDVKVKYMIGEAYADLSKESADERLEALKEKLQEQISSIENEQNEIKTSMATLKVKLYGKFKNSINLEED